MHGLETIQRLNAEACDRNIGAARNEGPVVVVYTGLHATRFEKARDDAHALQLAAEIEAAGGPSVHTRVLPKVVPAPKRELALAC